MLNTPTPKMQEEAEQAAVHPNEGQLALGGEWRIGDDPQRWDISLTDQIQTAIKQCVHRRLTFGTSVQRRQAA